MIKRLSLVSTIACAGLLGAETAGPDPEQALRDLLAGNARFVKGNIQHPRQLPARRTEVAKAQHPSAIILGCSDSRVPPEVVFDEGVGDLFVVRVAGNVVTDEVLGSVEYAVEHLGAKLVMVLGHERCGAVGAAVQGGPPEGHVAKLVDAIRPSVDQTKGKPGDPLENALRANVLRMVGLLQADPSVLKPGVQSGRVKIVGARYDLDSGAVEVLK